MLKTILTALLFFSGIVLYSQQIPFDIKNKNVAHFIELENHQGNIQFKSTSEFISFDEGVAQPIIYRHKESNLPDLLVYYFFHKSDSTIESILYEWDSENFEEFKGDKTKNEKEIQAFIEKYKTIYNSITQSLGKSDSEGDLTDLTKIATGDFQKTDVWKLNELPIFELEMTLSSLNEKHGSATIVPTYRIRLSIENKGQF